MCNTQLSDPYLPLFTVNQHAIGSRHAELHVNKAIQMFMFNVWKNNKGV